MTTEKPAEPADRLKEISDRIEKLSDELRNVMAELASTNGSGAAMKRAAKGRNLLADASFAVVCAAVVARDVEAARRAAASPA